METAEVEKEEDEGEGEGRRRSGNLFAQPRNWFWFSLSNWPAAAAAIIERGIHAFLQRCTPYAAATAAAADAHVHAV